jgi:uncharacterized repeat protein (TIGR01451 family)
VTVLEGNFGSVNALIPVRLSATPGVDVVVDYFTTDGSATAGSDYVGRLGTLIFPAGNTNLTRFIAVPITGDVTGETNETFFITLTNPVNATLARTQAVCTILSDEGPGILDHLEWSALAPTQFLNTPFAVTLTAKDIFNDTVPSFTNRVALGGLVNSGLSSSTILITEIETDTPDSIEFMNVSTTPVNIGGWQVFIYDSAGSYPTPINPFTVPPNTIAPPGAVFLLEEFGVTPGTFPAFFTGDNINWVNSVSGNPIAVLLRDNAGNIVDFVCAANSLPSDITNPTTIPTSQWSGASVPANTDTTRTYQRIGNLDGNNNTNWSTATPSPGVANAGIIVPFAGLSGAVPITPAISAAFTNGIWAGDITVLQSATNLTLLATDTNSLKQGTSRLFDVIVDLNLIGTNDLAVRVSATPEPVTMGQLLTYSISVTNSGPASSTGVRLTNTLPAGLPVVSVIPSQGSCSNSAGVIVCNFGTVPGASNATVIITVVPQIPGMITNSAAVSRNEPDALLANNTRTIVTSVLLPALAINDISVTESNAGAHIVNFTVTLSQASTQRVTVAYATTNGTALSGTDYAIRSGTLTFNAGVTTQNLAISILGDTLYEPDEFFLVNLSSPSNAMLAKAQGVGTILNDDPLPSLTLSNATVLEGSSGTAAALFVVRLSAAAGVPVTVDFATSDGTATAGSDYVATNGTITFAAGTSNLTQTINVTVNGDTLGEPDEFFFLDLTNAVNATLTVSRAVGTILSDEVHGILDHFEWSALAPTQFVNAPFNATITAKDAFNTTVSNFTGTVDLAGSIGTPSPTVLFVNGDFETGDFNGWVRVASGSGDFVINDGTLDPPSPDGPLPPFAGRYSALAQHVGPGLHSMYHQVSIPVNANGAVLNWAHRLRNFYTDWSAIQEFRVEIQNTNGNTLAVAFVTKAGDPLLDDWVKKTYDMSAFLGQTIRVAFIVNPGGFHLDAHVDNVVVTTVAVSVAIAPTISGTFIDGVWTGNITVSQTASNLTLRAADLANHRGDAAPLTVLPAVSDLALTLSDSPDPVAVSNTLTYTLTVLNRGPSHAAALSVSDRLPAGVAFVSAVSSNGSCANVAGTVTCNLTNLPSGSRASLTVLVTPQAAGTLTNTATVTVSGASDPRGQNNTATALTVVFSDRDHDGMPDQWEVENGLNPDDASDAPLDPDGDGMTNLQEYLAGTNPHDGGSLLQITRVLVIGREVHIFFTAVSGKRYRLERMVNGPAESWVPVLDCAAGATTELEVIDLLPAGETTRIYRVRLLLP